MTQHLFDTTVNGESKTVMAGFDRPTQGIFLTVFEGEMQDRGAIFYSHFANFEYDWTDPLTIEKVLNAAASRCRSCACASTTTIARGFTSMCKAVR